MATAVATNCGPKKLPPSSANQPHPSLFRVGEELLKKPAAAAAMQEMQAGKWIVGAHATTTQQIPETDVLLLFHATSCRIDQSIGHAQRGEWG
jgi:hypothetical protein